MLCTFPALPAVPIPLTVTLEHPSNVALPLKGWNITRHRAEYVHGGSSAQLGQPRLSHVPGLQRPSAETDYLFIHFTFLLVLSPFGAPPTQEEFYNLLRKSNCGAELCTAPGSLCSPWVAALL